jgi:hypothetical protein
MYSFTPNKFIYNRIIRFRCFLPARKCPETLILEQIGRESIVSWKNYKVIILIMMIYETQINSIQSKVE